jgi:hypothetical protein
MRREGEVEWSVGKRKGSTQTRLNTKIGFLRALKEA